MPFLTGSSPQPDAGSGRFSHRARTWIIGALYVAVITASALVAANSGSQAAAEAGRCLLAERNGAWGLFATAALGSVPLVAEIGWVRRLLTPSTRWTAAVLAVVVLVGHIALLAAFGFLLIRPGASAASNLANLATIPFSFAPTLAIASTATMMAPTWRRSMVRRVAALTSLTVCVALSAAAWAALMTRC